MKIRHTLEILLYIRIFAFFAVNKLKKFVFFVTIRVYSWLVITLFITNTNSALFRNKEEPASTAKNKDLSPGCPLYIKLIYRAVLRCAHVSLPLHEAR